MTTLFDPMPLADIGRLATRIVMAPLTRNRAGPGNVPTPLMAEYYAQRADPATGAALIVSEVTQICLEGRGYRDAPGLHSAEQMAGWRLVTGAVQTRPTSRGAFAPERRSACPTARPTTCAARHPQRATPTTRASMRWQQPIERGPACSARRGRAT